MPRPLAPLGSLSTPDDVSKGGNGQESDSNRKSNTCGDLRTIGLSRISSTIDPDDMSELSEASSRSSAVLRRSNTEP
eukprot:5859746-Prymnesium_polylepis.1